MVNYARKKLGPSKHLSLIKYPSRGEIENSTNVLTNEKKLASEKMFLSEKIATKCVVPEFLHQALDLAKLSESKIMN